jgi:hypothetical protein
MALVTHQAGDQAAARPYFDCAVALCSDREADWFTEFVTEDPPAFVRFFSSLNWWLIGDGERAEAEAAEALAIASRNGRHTWATMVSYWSASTLSVLQRRPELTLERTEIGIGLARAGGFGLGIPYMGVNRGWAMAALGDTDGGCATLIEGSAIAEAFGAEYLRPGFAAMHGEVCLMDGRPDDAVVAVNGGLALAEASGERWYESELLRVRAQAELALGLPEVARASMVSAIEVARAQGAVAFAERGAADLLALDGAA